MEYRRRISQSRGFNDDALEGWYLAFQAANREIAKGIDKVAPDGTTKAARTEENRVFVALFDTVNSSTRKAGLILINSTVLSRQCLPILAMETLFDCERGLFGIALLQADRYEAITG